MTIPASARFPGVFILPALRALHAGVTGRRWWLIGRPDPSSLSRHQLRDIGLEPTDFGPVFEIDARTMTRLMSMR